MTLIEKINLGVEKFLSEQGTLSEIRLELGLSSTKDISNRLIELGYPMYNGAKASSIKATKLAIEEYKNTSEPSLKVIAEKYKISKGALSRQLKKLGIEVVNHQNKTKFNENIFDLIDTEEKAYWLGFIYADGYVSSSNNQFELSLQGSDVEHLNKFNKFMECSANNKVKLGSVKTNGK